LEITLSLSEGVIGMDMEKLMAQIVEQLKETNRLLAIIAGAPSRQY
jgi:hypothetical protein